MRCAHPEDRLRRTTHDFAALDRDKRSRGWSAFADHDGAFLVTEDKKADAETAMSKNKA